MIECVFTVDYEIYGNGSGSLTDLVYEPARQLVNIFQNWNSRFVAFVEVAEFERIEACGTDPAIDLVKGQIGDLYREGFEIALHLHPQWCNAHFDHGKWWLDFSEYNLCTLPRARIAEIVRSSLDYLRHVVREPGFTPLAFRAGNWLFQPTETAASVLAEHGIKIDSSVFKGGLQHNHGLNYLPALRNGYYWSFDTDVNQPEPVGSWIEVPIHTEMVPLWRMATLKRLGFTNSLSGTAQGLRGKLTRLWDLLRFRYPLKLDFCRMTLGELTYMMDTLIREDREDPAFYRPIVAIGHTKDFVDPGTVDAFLCFLRANGVAISTFESIYPKLLQQLWRTASSSDGGSEKRRAAPVSANPYESSPELGVLAGNVLDPKRDVR